MTEDQRQQLEALAALPDEEIDFAGIPDHGGPHALGAKQA